MSKFNISHKGIDNLINRLSHLISKLGKDSSELAIIKEDYTEFRKKYNLTTYMILEDHIYKLEEDLSNESPKNSLPNLFGDEE
jgi:hypothetical protein